MTFEQWWEEEFPEDDFDASRFKELFEVAYDAGYSEARCLCE